MSIRVQQTPNPNARKFILPNRRFPRSLNVSDRETAAEHPLAAQLFALEGVYNVFWAQDFVTVNKLPAAAWDALMPEIERVLEEFCAGAADQASD